MRKVLPFAILLAAGVAQAQSANPLRGVKLWVDPQSQAARQYRAFRKSRAADARLIRKIAAMPQATWYGNWSSDIQAAVATQVQQAGRKNQAALLVAYNIPYRDCGQYSAGGSASAAKYRNWIRRLTRGIGRGRAVVVLEPDALAQLAQCLPAAGQQERLSLLTFAVRALKTNPGTTVYIDAGHPRWHPAALMAQRLRAAGIDRADGFALNVSNYVGTEENVKYGTQLSSLLGGVHFIIDTSRNGAGPAPGNAWCNPPGRALGPRPTIRTSSPVVDAYLWIKRPGESDGTCNGGPAAGTFWADAALDLARRARY
jgi:endoglucanase